MATEERNVIQIAQLALTAGMSLEQAVREFRWAMIESALALTKGNRVQAARILMVHRNTLTRDISTMAAKGRMVPRTWQRGSRSVPNSYFYRRGA